MPKKNPKKSTAKAKKSSGKKPGKSSATPVKFDAKSRQTRKSQREASAKTSTVKRESVKARESIIAKTEKIAKAQARLSKVVKQPKKQLAKTRKELKNINNQKYRLNVKLKTTKGKGSKRKKEEIKKKIADLTPKIAVLREKREAVKQIVTLKAAVSKDRRKLSAEIRKIDKLLEAADDAGNNKEFKRLLDLKDDIVMAEDAVAEALGETTKEADISGYKPYSGEWSEGFTESPISPVTVWQSQDEVESDLRSGRYDWFIIDTMLISAQNDGMVKEEMRQMRYYIEELAGKSGTPKIAIYYNWQARAAKYLPS